MSKKKQQEKERAKKHARIIEARVGIAALIVLAGISVYYLTRPESSSRSESKSPQMPVLHMPTPLPANTPEIVRGDTSKKQVIFTFDGGASAESADAILAALAKHGVKGTFFLTGKFIETYPDIARKMVASGAEVDNHTYHHPHLTEKSDGEIAGELKLMNATLIKATASSSGPYFRPPYGDRDARVNVAAARAGYHSVYWTIDARDWMAGKGETDVSVKARILENLAPGTIYLMHVGDKITGDILDSVFTEIESRGYKVVSLTQGL